MDTSAVEERALELAGPRDLRIERALLGLGNGGTIRRRTQDRETASQTADRRPTLVQMEQDMEYAMVIHGDKIPRD